MQELTFEQVEEVSGGTSSSSDMLHDYILMQLFRMLRDNDGAPSGGGGSGSPSETVDNYPGEGLPPK